MKAANVAIELRKLADAFDAQPEAEVIKPWITFYGYAKEPFLATVRLMPRPLKKKVEDEGSKWARVKVEYVSEAMDIAVSAPQSLTCEVVEPAKPAVYRCAPLLSEEEDAAMEVQA